MPPLAHLLRDVFDFCYPGVCPCCRSGCDGGSVACPVCEQELCRLETAAACEHCAMPLAEHGAPCPYCLGKGAPHFDRIVCLGAFHDPLKNLIHHMKYHGRWTIGEQLADRLLEQERAKGLLTVSERLVAVPLHPLRQMGRGYNQAHVIAARLAKRCDIPLVHPATRVRNTESQTQLRTAASRIENVKGAFALVDEKAVQGKHVLVIDDVRTTGATLQTLARTLRKAKPASLSAMLLAIADPRGRDFKAI